MDALTKKQEEVGKEIAQLLSNTRKDAKERRNASYILKRQRQLSQLWNDFTTRHKEIEKLNMPEHGYFVQKFFQQIEQRNLELEALLEKYSVDYQAEKEVSNSSVTQLQIASKKLQFRMQSLQSQVEKINLSEDLHLAMIEFHNKSLDEGWKNIETLYEEMITGDVEEHDLSALTKKYNELKLKIESVMLWLTEKKSITSENDIRLPRLTIPLFDGKYESWTAFHDLFVRLIHSNKRLANIEKMQYLKTHLKGEASRLLNHLDISDINYATVWKTITDRYNNKRKLVSNQIQSILSLPKLENESANGIKKLLDSVKECIHAITNLGVDTTSWAPFIVHILLQKVDSETHRLYEQSLQKPRDIPSFDVFYEFMESRFQSLEAITDNKKREQKPAPKLQRPLFRTYHSTTAKKCRFCQKQHSIYSCPDFQAIDTTQRLNFVAKNKLCANCINHEIKEKCRSQNRCSICQQRHHTLLHQDSYKRAQEKGVPECHSHFTEQQSQSEIQTHSATNRNTVFLATAIVKARAADGRTELLRALIDPGSQSSFVTEDGAQLLALPRYKTNAKIAGIGGTSAGVAHHKIQVQIQPRFPSPFHMNLDAFILKSLTKLLPDTNIHIPFSWENRICADPTFDKPGPIDVLLGADVYGCILLEGVYKHHQGLIAQETELGWIVTGQSGKAKMPTNICSLVANTDIDATLKKFWELEEVPVDTPTKHEDQCEQHYTRTHIRNKDGTYTVSIPFKENKQPLGESRRQAVARLLNMEAKFRNNKKLAQEYKQFMDEYLRLGHMTPVNHNAKEVYYMPHQAVIKNDSTTTKLRVVFDASAKTSTGISLNDNMLIGPRLQADLSSILLRWRKHKFVFTADIEKMYRQLIVNEKDRNYQRILWRSSSNEPIKEYALTTVTYGTASAP